VVQCWVLFFKHFEVFSIQKDISFAFRITQSIRKWEQQYIQFPEKEIVKNQTLLKSVFMFLLRREARV
jgi:hypothetical protein